MDREGRFFWTIVSLPVLLFYSLVQEEPSLPVYPANSKKLLWIIQSSFIC